MAARSVGTFLCTSDKVSAVDEAHLERGFHLVADHPDPPGHTNLRWFVAIMGGGEKCLDDYRFWDDKVVGDSTAYHIGAGIVVTAAHVILGTQAAGVKKPDETLLVFGLTDEQCPKESQAIVPAANVFVLDR